MHLPASGAIDLSTTRQNHRLRTVSRLVFSVQKLRDCRTVINDHLEINFYSPGIGICFRLTNRIAFRIYNINRCTSFPPLTGHELFQSLSKLPVGVLGAVLSLLEDLSSSFVKSPADIPLLHLRSPILPLSSDGEPSSLLATSVA